MKLLYCQDCGDIIAPHPPANFPRWCACERHAVWWVDPHAGVLRLYDKHTPPEQIKANRYPSQPRAYVLGITNSLLMHPQQGLSAAVIEQIIDSHPDSYLFKRWRSCIIRIRPGESSDTAWAPELPQ